MTYNTEEEERQFGRMFDNGEDYICYETAEIANTVEGEPVSVRRTFQIGTREIFKGKED